MQNVSIKELWMLLGEKDVQIYQLLKTIEVMEKEMEAMRAAYSLADRTVPSPATESSKAAGEGEQPEDSRGPSSVPSD